MENDPNFVFDSSRVRAATLRITAYRERTGYCSLSYVKDACQDNIGWTHTDLTWNNAPGNIVSNDGLNPADPTFTVDDLRIRLDPSKTTLIGEVDYRAGAKVGTQYFFDVTAALQEDTDGIVQFVLHGSNGLMDFATHANSGGQAYWPMLELLLKPEGADLPTPCPDAIVQSDLAQLAWTNPDPNDGTSSITCTVYLGTTPDRDQMDSITLAPNAASVAINTTNFPNYGNLQNLTQYYWVVDCVDPSREPSLIPGLMWSFTVINNNPPIVNAGEDQVVWLGKSGTPGQEMVYLDATVTDDGLPDPPAALTYLWTQLSGPTVEISPNNTEDTSITFTERGTYVFQLAVNDGGVYPDQKDTVQVIVGNDACDASHILTGANYYSGDFNQDCIVDLDDLAVVASSWLDCTDTLTNCGL